MKFIRTLFTKKVFEIILEIQLEDCIFIFTLFGIDSSESIDCFISLGHKYSLWKRHKTWKSKMWMKVHKN